jgi:hypothetical protein
MLRDVEYLPWTLARLRLRVESYCIHTWDVTLNLPNMIVRLEMGEDMPAAALNKCRFRRRIFQDSDRFRLVVPGIRSVWHLQGPNSTTWSNNGEYLKFTSS